MRVIVLAINIEISEQYGTTKTEIVGVFDKDSENIISLIETAKEKAKNKYSRQRTFFNELEYDLIK